MHSEARDSLWRQLCRGADGIDRIRSCLSDVDSKSAVAWSKHDEQRVKELILKTTGFDAVDETVREFLITWLLRQFRELVAHGHTDACNISAVSAEAPRKR